MGIHADKQRPIDSLILAVQADRLTDRQNMRLVEAALKRGAPMSRGAEGDLLCDICGVRRFTVIGRDELRHVDQK